MKALTSSEMHIMVLVYFTVTLLKILVIWILWNECLRFLFNTQLATLIQITALVLVSDLLLNLKVVFTRSEP